ncbi:MAG: phosphopyruvate hydratase [Clostridia bacterium]|nr:phosphopyruvate hydratase [Clostridia bacterium]
MKNKIYSIHSREIIDSRGMPTVEATVTLYSGHRGVASVPSGASTGAYEALELRDKEKRYFGKGVLKAVNKINSEIAPYLVGASSDSIYTIDNAMIKLDGTENKESLGANAILAVSLALAKANAKARSLPLYRYLGGIYARKMPIPMMNILNGGAHASNNIDIQEFMIVPLGFDSFAQALRAGCEIYNALKELLKKKGLSTSVGDEGGFAPSLNDDEEAIEIIVEAIKKAGYNTDKVKIALDIASSEWWIGHGKYKLPKANKTYSSEELIEKWRRFTEKYPILSIEDPLGENDYDGWQRITQELGSRVMLVGDDLFVTNSKRLQMGFDKGMGNAILIKPNQIGSLSETLNVIFMAKSKGYNTIISHRSGETDDTYIADIAVGTNAGFIKTGAPCRMERVAKYNRLLKIEGEIYKKHL